ncbi:MAG: hypothetical protein FJ128_12140 [Deltaproteobacteria bacterium]|nr:hypothetical protein [Deltaproteobacteria bacterium]
MPDLDVPAKSPLSGHSSFWPRLIFGLLWVLAIAKVLAITVADPDLWGYLAFGRLFWETGRFPYQDVFAYTPTLSPWVYHEWLTGVVFYPLYRFAGAAGLQLLKYALAVGTLVLLYLAARRRGAEPLAAALMIWMVQLFLEMGYSPVRAQVFTYFFFALSLYWLERARDTGSRWCLLGLVFLQIPWSNLHGGFLAGLGLIALYAVGERLSGRPCKPYLVAFGLAGLASLVNPYGFYYWKYLLPAVTMDRPQITEWFSFLQAYRSGLPLESWLYLAAVTLFVILLAVWARWRDLTAWLVLGVTLYLGIRHQRHQVFFFLAVGAYLPQPLSLFLASLRARPRLQQAGRRLGWAVPCCLALLLSAAYAHGLVSRGPLGLTLPALPDPHNHQAVYYPLGAVRHIQAHALKGRLLTEFSWGEYLLWTLYPTCKVALDGRFETVYPETVAQKYWNFIYGRDTWRRFLEDYPPDLILVDPRSRVTAFLLREPGWVRVYADAGSVLFLRSDNLAAERGH